MRTLKVSLLSLGLIAGLSSSASAQVGFDDVTSGPFAMVSPGYAGYNWNNAFVISPTAWFGAGNGGGFQTALHSGSYVMGNAGAAPLSISRASAFNLSGGFFAATWTNGLNLNASGYSNGNLVYSQNYSLSWNQSQYLNFNMTGVDNVVFTNTGGTPDAAFPNGSNNGFAFDDLNFNAEQNLSVNVVPEPMTVSLMGFGMLALGAVKMRRRGAAATR